MQSTFVKHASVSRLEDRNAPLKLASAFAYPNDAFPSRVPTLRSNFNWDEAVIPPHASDSFHNPRVVFPSPATREPMIDHEANTSRDVGAITGLLGATHLNDSDIEDPSGLATLLNGTHLEGKMTTVTPILNAAHLRTDYGQHPRRLDPASLQSEHNIFPMSSHPSSITRSSSDQQQVNPWPATATPADTRSILLVCPFNDAELHRCEYYREHGHRWMLRTSIDQRSMALEDHIWTYHDGFEIQWPSG